MTERTIIEPASVPDWPRGVRLRFDEARDQWVVVSPERVSVPNETAVEILRLVDGSRAVAGIAATLAGKFDAPEDVILRDVIGVVQDLSDKGMISTGA